MALLKMLFGAHAISYKEVRNLWPFEKSRLSSLEQTRARGKENMQWI